MEVQQQQSQSLHPVGAAASTMDTTMDIDMDLDLGHLPEPELIETEQSTFLPSTIIPDGAVDPQTAEAQYEKVHIRGVDELTTDNIKEFSITHFPNEAPIRVEWIDDTSANIVYSSPEIGLRALSAMTHANEAENSESIGGGEGDDGSLLPALRLRSAKFLASHPDSVLQVRSAVKTDKKRPRAHEASRFYLMHPEHDPRERLRRELADRRRSGGDGGATDGDYRRRRFDGQELRRRRDRDNEDAIITANMYDDAPRVSDDSDRGSSNRRRHGGYRHHRDQDADLFPDTAARSGRLRNRSASPGRDTLMAEGGYAERHESRRRQFRERSPRRNEGRELFPTTSSTTTAHTKPTISSSSIDDGSSRELFPNKTTDSYLKKELFPTNKHSNHRRSDAIDAADETADLFSRRISIPLVDGAQATSKRELFPDSAPSRNHNHMGVSIRGAAGAGQGQDQHQEQDQGFAIRGAAENGISIKGRGGSGGASARELFPSKYNSNAGKELFSDKIEGRGGPRRKAEDMFS